MPKKPKPVLLALTSDHHVNSAVGLCPGDSAVKLDEGGAYTASKAQKWLWNNWITYWAWIEELRSEHNAECWAIYDGDLVDLHSKSIQHVSFNRATIQQMALSVFAKSEQVTKVSRRFVVRGTESHSGQSAQYEEFLAEAMDAELEPDTGTSSWWELRLEVNNVRLDITHHGRMGWLPWTEQNLVNRTAKEVLNIYAEDGEEPPHLVIRGHCHRFGDSGMCSRVRAIQLPCWALQSAYAYRVATGRLPDIGGIAVLCKPSGEYEVFPKLFKPKRSRRWRRT